MRANQHIDGTAYTADFAGFDAPLVVHAPRAATLAPWTCREHLAAVARHLDPAPGNPSLDLEALADELLARAGLVEPVLRPLALWWAAGGDTPPDCDSAGWLVLGARRVRLRPWTARERLVALREHLAPVPDGSAALDLPSYLGAMLNVSVVEVDPPDQGDVDTLPAVVLAAVTRLNIGDPPAELAPAFGDSARTLAAATLKVCKALGWPPSRVWDLPAAELNHILDLLALADTPNPPPPSAAPPTPFPVQSSLARHPDSVVILFEDASP